MVAVADAYKEDLPVVRIIICGSREFNDYAKLCRVMDNIGIHSIANNDYVEIISGHARGADMLGEKFANQYGYPLKVLEADRKTYNNFAESIRNHQIAKYAARADEGIVVAFPIGSSRGTRNMVSIANQYGLEVYVIEEDDDVEAD